MDALELKRLEFFLSWDVLILTAWMPGKARAWADWGVLSFLYTPDALIRKFLKGPIHTFLFILVQKDKWSSNESCLPICHPKWLFASFTEVLCNFSQLHDFSSEVEVGPQVIVPWKIIWSISAEIHPRHEPSPPAIGFPMANLDVGTRC